MRMDERSALAAQDRCGIKLSSISQGRNPVSELAIDG